MRIPARTTPVCPRGARPERALGWGAWLVWVGLWVAAGAGPAAAFDWDSPAALERVCGRSAPLSDLLPSAADEPGWDDGEGDPMLEALRAHAHARERARWLVQSHRAQVRSDAIRLSAWDAQLGTISVDLHDGIELHRVGAHLVFPRRDAVMFDVGEREAERLDALWRLDALVLEVVFELESATHPDRAICEELPGGAQRVGAHLLAATLVDSVTGEAVVAMRTPSLVHREAVAHSLAPSAAEWSIPRVRLTSMHVLSEGVGPTEALTHLQLDLESRLSDCYLRALVENAGLQGALVLGFTLSGEGTIHDAEVLVDALDCARLSSCVLTALDDLRIPRGDGGGPAELRASMTFSRTRDEPGRHPGE